MILKLDCEGCEWQSLDETSEDVLASFRTIIVEFHWLEKGGKHDLYLRVMQKLLRRFRLMHTHVCNCFGQWRVLGTEFEMPRIIEATFVRSDLSAPAACVGFKYLSLDFPICRGAPNRTMSLPRR